MFKGTGTALITPFNDDLSVDYSSLKKIVRFQVDGGVDALIVLGTTGESPVINDEERKRLRQTGQRNCRGSTAGAEGITGSRTAGQVLLEQ